jgi:ribosomal-protein-alanine N-acetyltransferase
MTTLESSRLILRPFERGDAEAVNELAGDFAVARNTLNVPHPYPLEAAETWIGSHAALHVEHGHLHWAVCLKSGELIGSLNFGMNKAHSNALLGFWIGAPYWNQGYCTEAGRVAIDHAFGALALHRVHSHQFSRNAASGRVLQKLGFVREGLFKEHIFKDGEFLDVVYYGLMNGGRTQQD